MTTLHIQGRHPVLASRRTPIAPRGTIERFALLAMAAAFAVQPALHPSGPGNSSPVDVVILVSILAVAIWVASNRLPMRGPYLLGESMIIVGGAIAGAVGPLPATALLAIVQDIILIVWCVAIVAVANDPARLTLLAKAWAYSSTIAAAVLVAGSMAHITAITGVVAREGNRALFTFGDPNYAASYWVLSIFVVYACKAPTSRTVRAGGYALLLWALLLTESNGGIVELAVGCGFLSFVSLLRRYGPAAAITTLLLVAGALTITLRTVPFSSVQAWARASGNPLLVNSLGRSNDSSSQRTQLIHEALQLYESDGFLGSGPASTKPLLTVRSYPYAKEAHNDYLASLVENGPIGALGLLVIICSATWRATVVLRAPPSSRSADSLPRPEGIVAALLAASVAATYYEVLHFRFVWALLSMTAALAFEARRPTLRSTDDGSTS
ncbi:MAG: O-antigen ligase family protein [Actinomycetota bacterium]|nr:O-antigen ligase family protein [Actinomycetota bacterium]